MMGSMKEIAKYLRSQDACSKSTREMLMLVANHPRARSVMLSPRDLQRALRNAPGLFDSLGVRQKYSLADLCYLALHDETLMYAMSLFIESLVTP